MDNFSKASEYLKVFKFSQKSKKQDVIPFKSVFDNEYFSEKITKLLEFDAIENIIKNLPKLPEDKKLINYHQNNPTNQIYRYELKDYKWNYLYFPYYFNCDCFFSLTKKFIDKYWKNHKYPWAYIFSMDSDYITKDNISEIKWRWIVVDWKMIYTHYDQKDLRQNLLKIDKNIYDKISVVLSGSFFHLDAIDSFFQNNILKENIIKYVELWHPIKEDSDISLIDSSFDYKEVFSDQIMFNRILKIWETEWVLEKIDFNDLYKILKWSDEGFSNFENTLKYFWDKIDEWILWFFDYDKFWNKYFNINISRLYLLWLSREFICYNRSGVDFWKGEVDYILNLFEENLEIDSQSLLISREENYSIWIDLYKMTDDLFWYKWPSWVDSTNNYRDICNTFWEKEYFEKEFGHYDRDYYISDYEIRESIYDEKDVLNYYLINYLIENKDLILEEFQKDNKNWFYGFFFDKRKEIENISYDFLKKIFNSDVKKIDYSNNILWKYVDKTLFEEYNSFPDYLKIEIKKQFFLNKEFRDEKNRYQENIRKKDLIDFKNSMVALSDELKK